MLSDDLAQIAEQLRWFQQAGLAPDLSGFALALEAAGDRAAALERVLERRGVACAGAAGGNVVALPSRWQARQ